MAWRVAAVCAAVTGAAGLATALSTEGPLEVAGTVLVAAALVVLLGVAVGAYPHPARSDLARRVCAAVTAVILANIWRTSRLIVVEDQLWPEAWPWLWAFAGAACVLAALQPDRLDAWAASGLLLAVIVVGRMAATVARSDAGLITADRANFSLAVFALMLWFLSVAWWAMSPRRLR